MHRQRYIRPDASEAEVIRIDGDCYQRACVVEHEPDIAQEDISREFALCQECNCRGVGQYRFMAYQVVAQNAAGWSFARAHAGFPSEPQPSREEKPDPCCVIVTSNYQHLMHQRVSGRSRAWSGVKARATDEGARQQHAVHQVIGADTAGNLAGYDFLESHPLV